MPTAQNLKSPKGSSFAGPTGLDIHLPSGHTKATRQNLLTEDDNRSSPMPGLSNVREQAACDVLKPPEPQAKSSKERESDNDDVISINADQDFEQDNAADNNFLEGLRALMMQVKI